MEFKLGEEISFEDAVSADLSYIVLSNAGESYLTSGKPYKAGEIWGDDVKFLDDDLDGYSYDKDVDAYGAKYYLEHPETKEIRLGFEKELETLESNIQSNSKRAKLAGLEINPVLIYEESDLAEWHSSNC